MVFRGVRLTRACSAGDLSVEIDRVVNSLMQEGVSLALQELHRRSPPGTSSGETSSLSPFGGLSPTQTDSPRGPSGFSAPAGGSFAHPFPPPHPHSAGSSLRGGRWLEVPEGHAMRRSLSADLGQGGKPPQPRP